MMFLIRALRIFKDAIISTLPLGTRLRLLLLQPISLITYTIEWSVSRQFPHTSEIRIPLKRRAGSLRAVVYIPKYSQPPSLGKRPIHLNIHGGAFLGGLPEGNARFCSELAQRTGAVVISTSYRYTPRHVFPAAHEDVQDVARFLLENAEKLWNADPELFTISGFSVGGNLAFAVAQTLAGTPHAVKGCVTFYAVVDFRLPPWLKPKPPGFPAMDPLFFLQPLFDSYAGPNRLRDMENPFLHPTLANIRALPQNILFVIPGVDVLLQESKDMAQRLEAEAKMINKERGLAELPSVPDGHSICVKDIVFEKQLHGWLEMPSSVIDISTRTQAFDKAITFLRDVQQAYGYQ